ncbi:competence protein ComEA [Lentzea sp. NBRC 105346]|uniref:ComEA family DNA-binding protein n=1 Tax=Lentzea sp. NBRC 105346 TaxID=3032205 RepID=UPI002556FAC3|nr:ComEA family DNA-binding protein [Lentzea sp. NBRC 105346]GLZ34050.1 competence protein ComEA [Lentzea sp. NBRC 105346]
MPFPREDQPQARLRALADEARANPTVVFAKSEDADEHGHSRSRLRIPLPRRGLLAWAVAFAGLVIGVAAWWQQPPSVERPPTLAVASTPAPERLVVNVVGAVPRPGLVTVTSGARVADALDAAGGAAPGTDLHGLNLARKVTDGEQIAVGVPPPQGGAAPEQKLDLNSATESQLDGLPGVGPVTAQRIVAWRTRHGSFASVEQLREIDGIGDNKLAKLTELVHT